MMIAGQCDTDRFIGIHHNRTDNQQKSTYNYTT